MLNKSILDFSAVVNPANAIGRVASQNQTLKASDFGSASLHRGNAIVARKRQTIFGLNQVPQNGGPSLRKHGAMPHRAARD